jgi:LmbE family N-acetylglucosaminyl deacetylase
MSGEIELLDRLAACEPGRARIAVVAAHPDDEALCAATVMRSVRELVLIHLTDGAPADGRDAARAGFASPEAYAEARLRELDRALAGLGVRPRLRLRYGLTDQETVFHLPGLVRRLSHDLRGCDAVLTHAYEGGHPDHDTAAAAVQLACLYADGDPPEAIPRFEFAGYHACGGALVAGRFHPDPAAPEREVDAAPSDRRARADALAGFASQAATLAHVGFEAERLRLAPLYDFRRPPPAGEALYDQWGFSLTSAEWRAITGLHEASARPGARCAQAESPEGVGLDSGSDGAEGVPA